MKAAAWAAAAIGVMGAAIVGVVVLEDRERKLRRVPGSPYVPAVAWPGLNPGAIVLVDSQAANLPTELRMVATWEASVDMVLLDGATVAITIFGPGSRFVLFSGSVARESIVRVLSNPPRPPVVSG